MNLSRRRFLAITAGFTLAAPARAADLVQWRGIAMGADASITLAHPNSKSLVMVARAEIERLEDIFSLYRANSALASLNKHGRLENPPFELLECLDICDRVNSASGGYFDPTVQPLWRLFAETKGKPRESDRATAAQSIGWEKVTWSVNGIHLLTKGMALTLNGIAQGYIADRVANILEAEGLTDVLIETGEFRAIGQGPDRMAWPITLVSDGKPIGERIGLTNRSLASSASLGTVFDADAKLGHILDPKTGHPTSRIWQLVSVSSSTAALADGLSTAACLLDRSQIDQMFSLFPDVRLESCLEGDLT
jgi:thiamine biosynthesis lipoprotein